MHVGPGRVPAIVTAAGVLAGSSAIAAKGVPAAEEAAFHAVNELPAWLAPALWPPMQIGSLWGPVVGGLLTWRRWHDWRPTAGVVIGGVVAWQLAKVVKEFIRRGRPTDELAYIARRMGTPKDGRGFPSGHTAVAATMVTVLWPHVGGAERVGLVAAALVVAFARIQVGAHLPIDTVGGAALGVVTGELWRLAVGDGGPPAEGGTS